MPDINQVSLENVAIAAPCRVLWKDMVGSNKVRTCGTCKQHVYNLSEMTRVEAENLLSANSTEHFCLKLFRRIDGTILTKDCSIARRIVEKSAQRLRLAIASLLTFFNAAPAFAQYLNQVGSIDRYGFGSLHSYNSFENRETRALRTQLKNYDGEGADTRAMTYFNRALAYERFGKFVEALATYDQTLEIVRTKEFNGDPKFSQTVAAHNIVLLLKRGEAAKAKKLEREFCLNSKKIAALLKVEKIESTNQFKEEIELIDEREQTIAPEALKIPTDGSDSKSRK